MNYEINRTEGTDNETLMSDLVILWNQEAYIIKLLVWN